MPLDDPATWMKGATAFKAAIEGVRTAITTIRELSPSGGTQQQQKAIDQALTIASSNTAIAEAYLAQELGFELCRCQFPPTPMTTVGYFDVNLGDHKTGDLVFGIVLSNLYGPALGCGRGGPQG